MGLAVRRVSQGALRRSARATSAIPEVCDIGERGRGAGGVVMMMGDDGRAVHRAARDHKRLRGAREASLERVR